MAPVSGPWFAGQPGDFLALRVNRRPLRDDHLLAQEGMPADVLEHVVRVLAPGYEVTSGWRIQRTWRVGGVQVDEAKQVVFAKLGWTRAGEELVAEWSDAAKDWLSTSATPQGGRILPFAFDGETRLLAIVSDRQTPTSTITTVLEKILNENEMQLLDRTTEWSVEPILDAREFIEWLQSLDVVESVSFVARLPNPEPTEAMDDLVQRMEARRATKYEETMRSKAEDGLVGIEHDRDVRQAIAMGKQGFALLRGIGLQDGVRLRYKQTDAVAHERVEELPRAWDVVWIMLAFFVKDTFRRFLQDDQP